MSNCNNSITKELLCQFPPKELDVLINIITPSASAGNIDISNIKNPIIREACEIAIANTENAKSALLKWSENNNDKLALYEAIRERRTERNSPATIEYDANGFPLLPEDVRLAAELGATACRWLDEYIKFSRYVSPRAYDDFHEAAGVWLLSTIAARRLRVRFGVKHIYPSLYILFNAHTSMYAKTTTADVAIKLLEKAGLRFLLAPDEATPQAFIKDLSLRAPSNYDELPEERQDYHLKRLAFAGQRGWFYDEFGMKISAMMKQSGAMADFRGLLRIFDDGRNTYEYTTIGRGSDLIEEPYLALLASCTPADFRPYASPGSDLWRDGFWARFAFITPPRMAPPSFVAFPADGVPLPDALIEPLKNWHMELGEPRAEIYNLVDGDDKSTGKQTVEKTDLPQTTCTLADGVMNAYNRYNVALLEIAHELALDGNSDLIGNYARFHDKALRMAMLFASLENHGVVEMKHWSRAQAIAERWRINLHNLYNQMQTTDLSEEAKKREKVLYRLATKLGGKGTAASIAGYLRRTMKSDEIDEICQELVEEGMLEIASTTSRGTNVYQILS